VGGIIATPMQRTGGEGILSLASLVKRPPEVQIRELREFRRNRISSRTWSVTLSCGFEITP
jgi:hypothetical protein